MNTAPFTVKPVAADLFEVVHVGPCGDENLMGLTRQADTAERLATLLQVGHESVIRLRELNRAGVTWDMDETQALGIHRFFEMERQSLVNRWTNHLTLPHQQDLKAAKPEPE